MEFGFVVRSFGGFDDIFALDLLMFDWRLIRAFDFLCEYLGCGWVMRCCLCGVGLYFVTFRLLDSIFARSCLVSYVLDYDCMFIVVDLGVVVLWFLSFVYYMF